MKRKIALLAFSLLAPEFLYGQETEKKESPFSFPVSYKGETVSNLMGGIATGTEYLGYGTVGINFDTETAKFWKGGSFYIEGATTHGGSPSEDYIGDAQVASNIEAGNHVYLQRFHFAQEAGNFFGKVGLLDLNDDFAACESAALFHNSSFGIHSVISYNFDAPIFPLTGLGLVAGYNISDKWTVMAGAYDGGPIQFEDGNPYNVNWELNINKGYLLTAEVKFAPSRGTYCINGYYHTGLQRRGLSVSADQNIVETDFHKLNLFLYAAMGDRRAVRILNYNINAGVKLEGVFSKKMKDCVGLGCATSCFVDGFVETALEFVYSYRIGSWISIEPDIQYIINPPCHDITANNKNALVAALRFAIDI